MSTCIEPHCSQEAGDCPRCRFCHENRHRRADSGTFNPVYDSPQPPTMAEHYPAYYKNVRHLSHIDVYAVHCLFEIEDPSGAIQHASKKLLLSGSRTGGKSRAKDIREARDTLDRWLEMNPEET